MAVITQTGTTAAVLARAAAMAGYAPSAHNTQPWRWTVLADRLELSAVRERQLSAADPDGRLLVMSCGAALQHAQAALAAMGWDCTVDRLPNPARPDLLAVLTPTAHHAPQPEAMRVVQLMEVRHTDRRPLSDQALDEAALTAISDAVRAEGLGLHVLTSDEVYDLAAAASRAGVLEAADTAAAQELAYWIGRGDGLGMPDHVLPATAPQTRVPDRDFGRAGTLPAGPGHDRAATYAMVYGDSDEPAQWLRAGEALSAAWLTATGLGVALLPLTAAVEVLATRVALRRLLSDYAWPLLVLRLGVADAEHAGPAHTPRLSPSQIVDTAEVRHLLDRN
jgi:nitroreductase